MFDLCTVLSLILIYMERDFTEVELLGGPGVCKGAT